MRRIFYLEHELARRNAIRAVQDAPWGMMIAIQEKTRTLQQNALLWPLLTCVSKKVEWFGKLRPEENWKDLFTAELKDQLILPRISKNGFVVCGRSTKDMSKKEFSNLIEIIYSFGAEHNIDFEKK